MRLTLRTLLAYLDNVLDSQVEEVLAEKVRTSEFASSLVQRIQSCLRQSRLSAPDPRSESGPDDPNVMAEYLDSTLPPDQVAGVERACIESDVRLAEAAACHQVLTLVLGSPAEVSPALRERVYAVGQERRDVAAAATVAPVAAEAVDAVLQTGTEAVPTEPPASLEPPKSVAAQLAMASAAGQPIDNVPDYLRRGSWRRLTGVVVTLVLAVAFLFLLSQALRPVGQSDREGLAVADRAVEPEPDAAPEPAAAPAVADPPVRGDIEPDDPPAAPAAIAQDTTADADVDREAIAPDATQTDAAAGGGPATVTTEADAAADVGGTEGETADAGTPAEAELAEAPAEGAEGEVAPVGDAAVGGSAPTPPAAPGASPLVAVGQALDQADALLVRAAGDAQWHRLMPGEEIRAGVQVVNLPTFRSRIMLSAGVDLTLVDATVITPLSATELDVQQGRLLASATAAGVELQLNIAGQTGTLVLDDLQSEVAVEVTRVRPPGADPLVPGASQAVAELVAVQGNVRWTAEGGTEIELATGQKVRLFGQPERVADVTTAPAWIDAPDDQLLSIEQTAREGLLQQLADADDVAMALRETVGFRRAEVAALAARSLATLGVTDVFFGPAGVLNRDSQRNYWDAHVAALRQRVDLGPEAALAVQQSITRMSAAQAPVLFRMLQGFSDEQLAAGGAADLVKWLDHPLMSVRVLAIETLRRITGETLSYRAETDNPGRRESMIKRWETRLNRDGIRHAGPTS